MSVAVKLRVVRNQRDEFACTARCETVTVGRCVGRQIVARDTRGQEHAPCERCVQGVQIARDVGVSFGPPATMVVV